MNIVYRNILKPYVFFLIFLPNPQNETNFQTEKIIDQEQNIKTEESITPEQQEKLNILFAELNAEHEKYKKQQNNWLLAIGFFIFLMFIFIVTIIFFSTPDEKKKLKIPGIYAERNNWWEEIINKKPKLTLFLGDENNPKQEYYQEFFLFFEKVFQVLTKDISIDFQYIEYAPVIQFREDGSFSFFFRDSNFLPQCFRDLDFFQSAFEDSYFFDGDMLYSIGGEEKIKNKAQIEVLKQIQELKIQEQKKNFVSVEKEKIFLSSYFPLFKIETFFNLTLSQKDVLFAIQKLPTEDGSYFISGFDVIDIPSLEEYNNQRKQAKLYKQPLLLNIKDGIRTYESNFFLLFIFIICYDRGYLDLIDGGPNYLFKIQEPGITKIDYSQEEFYYYFGKNFFVIFFPCFQRTKIFDLRCEKEDPSFNFVYGTPDDSVLMYLRDIKKKEQLKIFTDKLMEEKNSSKNFSKLKNICFLQDDLSHKKLKALELKWNIKR